MVCTIVGDLIVIAYTGIILVNNVDFFYVLAVQTPSKIQKFYFYEQVYKNICFFKF